MRRGWMMATTAATLALAGCGDRAEEGAGAPPGDILANALVPAAKTNQVQPAVPLATAAWIGRWAGPEGLFLDVAADPASPEQYNLTIKADLDGAGNHYVGREQDGTIRFVRAGKDEVIRPGDGAQTGLKWLAGKKECLIVVPQHEGYCRD
ncbi:MAG: hypothetical protein JWM75_2065 [Sphingomonas bacterium]|nr:hypothetical protein [Sphingomonas bacterium]